MPRKAGWGWRRICSCTPPALPGLPALVEDLTQVRNELMRDVVVLGASLDLAQVERLKGGPPASFGALRVARLGVVVSARRPRLVAELARRADFRAEARGRMRKKNP